MEKWLTIRLKPGVFAFARLFATTSIDRIWFSMWHAAWWTAMDIGIDLIAKGIVRCIEKSKQCAIVECRMQNDECRMKGFGGKANDY